jgi:hypothetical protein
MIKYQPRFIISIDRIETNEQQNQTIRFTISFKFMGKILSKHILLFQTRHEMYPYISKTWICFHISHISKVC